MSITQKALNLIRLKKQTEEKKELEQAEKEVIFTELLEELNKIDKEGDGFQLHNWRKKVSDDVFPKLETEYSKIFLRKELEEKNRLCKDRIKQITKTGNLQCGFCQKYCTDTKIQVHRDVNGTIFFRVIGKCLNCSPSHAFESNKNYSERITTAVLSDVSILDIMSSIPDKYFDIFFDNKIKKPKGYSKQPTS